MFDEAPSRPLDVRKLARKAVLIEWQLDLDDLPRVRDAVLSASDKVAVKLQFDRNEEGRFIITGAITAGVQLTCQRCLEAVDFAVDIDVDVVIVWDEIEANALARHKEAFIAQDEANLLELIEEEILLAIPYIAYHESCDGVEGYKPEPEMQPDQSESKENPFKVLEQLKNK